MARGQHLVYFFGTKKIAYVSKAKMLPLTDSASMAKMLVSLTPPRKHALRTALDEARLTLNPSHVAFFDSWAAAGLGQQYARGMLAAFKIAQSTNIAVFRSMPGQLLQPASPTAITSSTASTVAATSRGSALEELESPTRMSSFDANTAFALAALAKMPPDSRELLRFKLVNSHPLLIIHHLVTNDT